MTTHKKIKRPNIDWQDLRYLSVWQKLYNIILPYPFLMISWYFAYQQSFVMAVIFSYFFVITAYRQGHDLYHRSLGVHRYLSTFLLVLISLLSFSSLHSMKYSHLEHHRNPLSENDEEGYLAHGTWYQALMGGLEFRYRIYKHGYRLAPTKEKTKIILESLLIVLLVVITFFSQSMILLYQFWVMFVINIFAGVFAVWGLHHDCDDGIARTERNPVVNALTFNLFYHVEHHLFPAVPTQHLPKLAKRLDKHAPHLTKNKVFGILSISWIQKQDNDCPIKGLFA